MRAIVLVLATGLGAGYAPIAPGSAGSVLGLALWYAAFVPLWERSPVLCLAAFAAAFVAAVWIAGRAEAELAEHDSPRIVIDEVLGMVATLIAVPAVRPLPIAGFLAFRVLDIIKPPPARWVERNMRGGAAVMLDDLVAAVYANLALQALVRLW
jgi:phosphatidylglycerophosphatase A